MASRDAIITNENNFNDDWDGNWRHAVVSNVEEWTVEVLLPWHLAPMRGAGDKRTLSIYLDRVVGSTGERAGWPLASFERPRFLSDFAPIEVSNYSQSLLAITPYVSGLYDNVGNSSDGDAGADIFWKPNGQTQLTATVNPDFGQVESDDLVVNFSATETFISDKRPFFTENQGIFEFTTPSDFSQLLYTRRVGGPADDGIGAGDIIAALKLNGSVGNAKYGLFAADEAESVGRTFAAARGVRDFNKQNLGFMATWVDRPYLDRRGHRLRRGSQLAADGALERAHARVRQRHRSGGRKLARHRRHGMGRLRDGSRLAAAVHGHALWQRSPDQRRRLSLAQQHQLRPLRVEEAASPSSRRSRATLRRTGAGVSAPTTTIAAIRWVTSSASAARASCAMAAMSTDRSTSTAPATTTC